MRGQDNKNMPKCEYVNLSRREDENLRKCFLI